MQRSHADVPVATFRGLVQFRRVVVFWKIRTEDLAAVGAANVRSAVAENRFGHLEAVSGLKTAGHVGFVRMQNGLESYGTAIRLDRSRGGHVAVSSDYCFGAVPVDVVYF